MDKRKAYALTHPVRDETELREGHKHRVERRFATALFTDGRCWTVRVEYLDFNFRRQRLGQMPPGGEARMVEVLERVYRETRAGVGPLTFRRVEPYALEAERDMGDEEISAVSPLVEIAPSALDDIKAIG